MHVILWTQLVQDSVNDCWVMFDLAGTLDHPIRTPIK
jgi:hypothetical protein